MFNNNQFKDRLISKHVTILLSHLNIFKVISYHQLFNQYLNVLHCHKYIRIFVTTLLAYNSHTIYPISVQCTVYSVQFSQCYGVVQAKPPSNFRIFSTQKQTSYLLPQPLATELLYAFIDLTL